MSLSLNVKTAKKMREKFNKGWNQKQTPLYIKKDINPDINTFRSPCTDHLKPTLKKFTCLHICPLSIVGGMGPNCWLTRVDHHHCNCPINRIMQLEEKWKRTRISNRIIFLAVSEDCKILFFCDAFFSYL